jgi:hypothetical protein
VFSFINVERIRSSSIALLANFIVRRKEEQILRSAQEDMSF